MKKQAYIFGGIAGLIILLMWMHFDTTTKEVQIVSSDCGDISEIGTPTELFHPATVHVTDQLSGQTFVLRFPSVFLGADMPLFDSSGKSIETWQSSQFCGDRGLFGYTSLVRPSNSLRVNYNHFGRIVSWQLVDR